jgi:hypothetical protein
MGYLYLIQDMAWSRQAEITCSVKPHYKLKKPNSNFVLKYLFNALAQKQQTESVSLVNGLNGKFEGVAAATL